MKEKKYHESTETIRDRAKMNLDGNYFELCHEITNEPERLLFLPYRSVYWYPWSVHWLILFSHTMRNVQRMSFYQCLPCCQSSCSFSSSSLIFFFLMKLKSSKVLFHFVPLAPLTIILLKPRPLTTQSLIALTDAFANATNRVDMRRTHTFYCTF